MSVERTDQNLLPTHNKVSVIQKKKKKKKKKNYIS